MPPTCRSRRGGEPWTPAAPVLMGHDGGRLVPHPPAGRRRAARRSRRPPPRACPPGSRRRRRRRTTSAAPGTVGDARARPTMLGRAPMSSVDDAPSYRASQVRPACRTRRRAARCAARRPRHRVGESAAGARPASRARARSRSRGTPRSPSSRPRAPNCAPLPARRDGPPDHPAPNRGGDRLDRRRISRTVVHHDHPRPLGSVRATAAPRPQRLRHPHQRLRRLLLLSGRRPWPRARRRGSARARRAGRGPESRP